MRRLVFLIIIFLSSCSEKTEMNKEETAQYNLLIVESRDYETETEYSAQIRGMQDIRIIPRVEGYLQDILVKEGQNVTKGQKLFVLDQVAYKASLKTAHASFKQAQTLLSKAEQDYEAQQILFQKNVVSQYEVLQSKREYDMAQAKLEAAQAELDIANNNLSFTELRSPSNGVIGRIPYRKGDFVGPTTTDGLTIVCDNHSMYVYFSLSEISVMKYLSEYKSIQQAIDSMPSLSLFLPGDREYSQNGRVESISGIIDEQTGAVSVRAIFPNESGLLLSGGTGRIAMPTIHSNVIVIPQEATYEIQNKVYAYKVVRGETESTMIDVERLNNGKSFIVKSGLNEGDTIIAQGAGLVKEGESVIVNKELRN